MALQETVLTVWNTYLRCLYGMIHWLIDWMIDSIDYHLLVIRLVINARPSLALLNLKVMYLRRYNCTLKVETTYRYLPIFTIFEFWKNHFDKNLSISRYSLCVIVYVRVHKYLLTYRHLLWSSWAFSTPPTYDVDVLVLLTHFILLQAIWKCVKYFWLFNPKRARIYTHGGGAGAIGQRRRDHLMLLNVIFCVNYTASCR